VKKEIDCQIFGDQLDTLLDGSLSGEGTRQLQLHALSCPDCAMALRVQEHLALPSLEELEAAVPEELLASMWPKVRAEVAAQRMDVSAGTSFPKRFRWHVPTLAAASVTLLFFAGFLFSELKRSEARELQLAQQVGELDRSGDGRTEWVERTAELAGGGRNRARALDYVLSGQDYVTLDALLEILGRYPESIILFDAAQVEALSGTNSRPPPELRKILAALGDPLTTLGDAEGIRVGEFAEWLASLSLPPDMILPKSPLIELLS